MCLHDLSISAILHYSS